VLKIKKINFLGKNAQFHHIGLVVNSIGEWENMETIDDPIQKVRVGFILLNNVITELIEPLGKESPVYNSLQQGKKLIHICYQVPCINDALAESKKHKFICIQQPVFAKAFNSNIAWIYNKDYGVIELLEERRA